MAAPLRSAGLHIAPARRTHLPPLANPFAGACRNVNSTEEIRPGTGPESDGWTGPALQGATATDDDTSSAPLAGSGRALLWDTW